MGGGFDFDLGGLWRYSSVFWFEIVGGLLRGATLTVLLFVFGEDVIAGLPGGEEGLDFFGVEIGGGDSFFEVLPGAGRLFDNDLHRVIFIPFE